MEAVNGGASDADRNGGAPPPPSPLTGCYLLIVVGEPHSSEHKDIILQRVAKGLLSWDLTDCLVDLEKELAIITEQALEGEEARYGERLIQFASENLVTEILIHPVVSTLAQCVRNLLSSFTRHRHIIHAGYTFSANGSWILQDGTFSLADFSEAFQEIEVQRVIHAYENGISLDVHCAPDGDWSRLPKEPFAKFCNLRVNPNDVLNSGSPSITNFINYIAPFLTPAALDHVLENSDVVGNIRFSRPTLYVFPGGQGDAALFGINGFNMLLDGGFSRKACFWDFVRHLDRLDAVLMTRLNNSNVSGMSAVLKRKNQNAVYPQIGHFFCNLQERKSLLSPDGDKDKDPLLINLFDEGHEIISNLQRLNLTPQVCYRDSEPINLYHKVGHGSLNMYVLSPAKDSKEVREFLQKWNANDAKLFANIRSREFQFPLQNLVSICALLVWQPANPDDTITRILFPGSAPQHKVFEGLDRLRNLDFVKYPVCTEKSLLPASAIIKSKQIKDSILDKIVGSEKKPPIDNRKDKVRQIEKIVDGSDSENNLKNGHAIEQPEKITEKTVTKSDSTESEKSLSKPKKVIENGDKTEKFKPKLRSEMKTRSESQSRSTRPLTKKPSPPTPKKSTEKLNGDIKELKPKTKASPSATPAKSTKDANNRKVIESKTRIAPKKETPKVEKKESKPLERKPISRRPKEAPKPTGSPSKKLNGVHKPDTLTRRAKLDKEGTTDSSTVSTPSADQETTLKKDISKLTSDELKQLKAQELADLKEEQEAVKEIEAVFRKGETKGEQPSDLIKIKDVSIDKAEKEEYLIVEKTEIQIPAEDKDSKEEEVKHTRDSEESEKPKKPIDEVHIEIKEQPVEVPEEPKIDEIKSKEEIVEPSKETSITSQEEKVEVSTDKKVTEEEVKDVAPESQPDEKCSTNIESGATTTAPTLPEDERIPLDEIKEDNGQQVIEEKHVKEDTKEKDVPVIQLPAKTFEPIPKLPPVVGIRLDKQSHIRDIVKTPDEVADLPVHEEVDIDNYAEYPQEQKEIPAKDAKSEPEKAATQEKDKIVAEIKEPKAPEAVPEKKEDIPKEVPKVEEEKIKTEQPEIEEKKESPISPPEEKVIKGKKELSKSSDEEKDKDEKEVPENDIKSNEKIEKLEKSEDILGSKEPIIEEITTEEKPEKIIPIEEKIEDKLGKCDLKTEDDKIIEKPLDEKINEDIKTDVMKIDDKLDEKEKLDEIVSKLDDKSEEKISKTDEKIETKIDEKVEEKLSKPDEKVEITEVKLDDKSLKTEEKIEENLSKSDENLVKESKEKTVKIDEKIEEPLKLDEKPGKQSEEKPLKIEEKLDDKYSKIEEKQEEKLTKPDEKQEKESEQKLLKTDEKLEEKSVESEEKQDEKSIKTEEKIEEKSTKPDEKPTETVIKSDEKFDEKTPKTDEKIEEKPIKIEEKTEVKSEEKVLKPEEKDENKTLKLDDKSKETDEKLEKVETKIEETVKSAEKVPKLDEKPSIKEEIQQELSPKDTETKIAYIKSEEKEIKPVVEDKTTESPKIEQEEHKPTEKSEIIEEKKSESIKIEEKTPEIKREEKKLEIEKIEDSNDKKSETDKESTISEKPTEKPQKTEEISTIKIDINKIEETTKTEVIDTKPEEVHEKIFTLDDQYSEMDKDFEDDEDYPSQKQDLPLDTMDIDTEQFTLEHRRASEAQIKVIKDDNDGISRIDVKLQQLKDAAELERTRSTSDLTKEVITVDRSVEKPEHAEPVIIPTDSTPESPMVEDRPPPDRNELGRKSPQEREEDVIKIVASVAEVLKSDAPLEEFEGKLPFPTYTPYTTELRETHITTQDSPSKDKKKSEESEEILATEEKIESKISTLMKDSNEFLKTTSKMISDIKEGQSVQSEKDDQEESGTVHRMLVTASSEDGGEETEICPAGTITFAKSSESSGHSSPEPLLPQAVETSVGSTISDIDSVKEKEIPDQKTEVKPLKDLATKEIEEKDTKPTEQDLDNKIPAKDVKPISETKTEDVKVETKDEKPVSTEVPTKDAVDSKKIEEIEEEIHQTEKIVETEKKDAEKVQPKDEDKKSEETKKSDDITKKVVDEAEAVIDQVLKDSKDIIEEKDKTSKAVEKSPEKKPTEKFDLFNGLEEAAELVVDILTADRKNDIDFEKPATIIDEKETKTETISDKVSHVIEKVEEDVEILGKGAKEIYKEVKEDVAAVIHPPKDVLQQSAKDIEKNFDELTDMTKSVVFEKCEKTEDKTVDLAKKPADLPETHALKTRRESLTSGISHFVETVEEDIEYVVEKGIEEVKEIVQEGKDAVASLIRRFSRDEDTVEKMAHDIEDKYKLETNYDDKHYELEDEKTSTESKKEKLVAELNGIEPEATGILHFVETVEEDVEDIVEKAIEGVKGFVHDSVAKLTKTDETDTIEKTPIEKDVKVPEELKEKEITKVETDISKKVDDKLSEEKTDKVETKPQVPEIEVKDKLADDEPSADKDAKTLVPSESLSQSITEKVEEKKIEEKSEKPTDLIEKIEEKIEKVEEKIVETAKETVEEVKEIAKEIKDTIIPHSKEDEFVKQTAKDIEEEYKSLQDISKSTVFEKCEEKPSDAKDKPDSKIDSIKDEKTEPKSTNVIEKGIDGIKDFVKESTETISDIITKPFKEDDFAKKTAHDLEENYKIVEDMSKSIIFGKCEKSSETDEKIQKEKPETKAVDEKSETETKDKTTIQEETKPKESITSEISHVVEKIEDNIEKIAQKGLEGVEEIVKDGKKAVSSLIKQPTKEDEFVGRIADDIKENFEAVEDMSKSIIFEKCDKSGEKEEKSEEKPQEPKLEGAQKISETHEETGKIDKLSELSEKKIEDIAKEEIAKDTMKDSLKTISEISKIIETEVAKANEHKLFKEPEAKPAPTERRKSISDEIGDLTKKIEESIEKKIESIEEFAEDVKDTLTHPFKPSKEEEFVKKTAADIEENYKAVEDMSKSVIFEKCELSKSPETDIGKIKPEEPKDSKPADSKLSKEEEFVKKTADDLEQNFKVVEDLSKSVTFEKCEIPKITDKVDDNIKKEESIKDDKDSKEKIPIEDTLEKKISEDAVKSVHFAESESSKLIDEKSETVKVEDKTKIQEEKLEKIDTSEKPPEKPKLAEDAPKLLLEDEKKLDDKKAVIETKEKESGLTIEKTEQILHESSSTDKQIVETKDQKQNEKQPSEDERDAKVFLLPQETGEKKVSISDVKITIKPDVKSLTSDMVPSLGDAKEKGESSDTSPKVDDTDVESDKKEVDSLDSGIGAEDSKQLKGDESQKILDSKPTSEPVKTEVVKLDETCLKDEPKPIETKSLELLERKRTMDVTATFIDQEITHARLDASKYELRSKDGIISECEDSATVDLDIVTPKVTTAGPSIHPKDTSLKAKTSIEDLHLSGKSTPDIAEVERQKEIQDTLKHEKHIPGSCTPPTVPVSPVVKEKEETKTSPKLDARKTLESAAVAGLKEAEIRSSTPGSDDYEIGASSYSDLSSGQVSRAPHVLESERLASDDDDDDMPGSPLSTTSQVAHSRSLSQYDFEEDRPVLKLDPMNMSCYESLPDMSTPKDTDFKTAIEEHRGVRGDDDVMLMDATYLHDITKARFTVPSPEHRPRVESDLMTSSFIGSELPSSSHDPKDPIEGWGKPLGLPSPAPPHDNKTTPKKERKLPANVSAKNKLNDDRKRAESPSKYRTKKISPVYVDLTYVPHHGNAYYAYVDFFKRVRARYYVFSGIEPSREVYNALLEAKQTWEDRELEVTIIPTYDTDILGYWVAENEELLTKYKIDLSPSASRCTINLQDHETSCSAYRLEF